MSASTPIYYWDSRMYLAWLTEDQAYAESLPSIFTILSSNFMDDNIIVTSSRTADEIKNAGLDESLANRFSKLLNDDTHKLIEVTDSITEKAAELREKSGVALSELDAIHLATALDQNAAQLHTPDDEALLGLDGSELVGNLVIKKPSQGVRNPFAGMG